MQTKKPLRQHYLHLHLGAFQRNANRIFFQPLFSPNKKLSLLSNSHPKIGFAAIQKVRKSLHWTRSRAFVYLVFLLYHKVKEIGWSFFHYVPPVWPTSNTFFDYFFDFLTSFFVVWPISGEKIYKQIQKYRPFSGSIKKNHNFSPSFFSWIVIFILLIRGRWV